MLVRDRLRHSESSKIYFLTPFLHESFINKSLKFCCGEIDSRVIINTLEFLNDCSHVFSKQSGNGSDDKIHC